MNAVYGPGEAMGGMLSGYASSGCRPGTGFAPKAAQASMSAVLAISFITSSMDMASAEERETDPGTEPPSRVDHEADRHGCRHARCGDRLALERRDEEPRDKRRQDGAEHDRAGEQPRAVEPSERCREHRAPYGAPECERP